MSTHAEFVALVQRGHAAGKISAEVFRRADLAASFMAVLEHCPEASPQTKVAAEKAIRKFHDALIAEAS